MDGNLKINIYEEPPFASRSRLLSSSLSPSSLFVLTSEDVGLEGAEGSCRGASGPVGAAAGGGEAGEAG